jgi:hypothetical protein
MKQLRIWGFAVLATASLAATAQTSPSLTTAPTAPALEENAADAAVDIDLVITSATSREDLATMQKDLYPKGVKFHYSNITWADGRLTDILVHVSTVAGKDAQAEFNGIAADQEIRLVVRGAGDAQQICLGSDCDRKFPRRD